MRVIGWIQWNNEQMEAAEGINSQLEGCLRTCEVILCCCSNFSGFDGTSCLFI